jgi:hypothetical protein
MAGVDVDKKNLFLELKGLQAYTEACVFEAFNQEHR